MAKMARESGGSSAAGGRNRNAQKSATLPGGDEFQRAAKHLADAILDSAEFIGTHRFYTDDLNRGAAVMFLEDMLLWSLEYRVNNDLDYPYFRVMGMNTRVGGNNADQRYLNSLIRGGETYRVWGTKGSCRRFDLQVYAGQPWYKGKGRSAAVLEFEDINFNPDGSFEITLSPERVRGNWLENPPDATEVMVRQIFSDWRTEVPGHIHIDRSGYEGKPKPAISEAEAARRLRDAAEQLKQEVQCWPDWIDDMKAVIYPQFHKGEKHMPANILPPAVRTVSSLGAFDKRYTIIVPFALGEGEALVVTTWPASGNYQGIQLMDDWMQALEYANRQTSLTADQAYLSKDSAYHFVIAHRDPGIQNWLDTMGMKHGGIIIRYDGLREKMLPEQQQPVSKKIRLEDLRAVLPEDTPTITPAQREAELKVRRQHVQRRFFV